MIPLATPNERLSWVEKAGNNLIGGIKRGI